MKLTISRQIEAVKYNGVTYEVVPLTEASRTLQRDAARRVIPAAGDHLGSAPFLSKYFPAFSTTPQLYSVPNSRTLYATAVSERSQFSDLLVSLVPV